METNDQLILRAQGIARTLTYNEEPEGSAKRVIAELCHRLDALQADAREKGEAWPGLGRLPHGEYSIGAGRFRIGISYDSNDCTISVLQGRKVVALLTSRDASQPAPQHLANLHAVPQMSRTIMTTPLSADQAADRTAALYLHPPVAGDVEPVAWQFRVQVGGSWLRWMPCTENLFDEIVEFGENRYRPAQARPLYTHPPVADAALDAEKLGAFVASILNLDEDFIGDVDGGTLQDEAEKYGLLQAVEVTESCGEGCACSGYGDFPQTCYQPTETMRRAIAALNQRGGG